MPNALILHLNDLSDAMISTSLIRRLTKEGYSVCCITDENSESLFEFSGAKNLTVEMCKSNSFDLAINLSPSFICADIINEVKANEKLGYGIKDNQIHFYNDGAFKHYKSRHLLEKTNSNLFQLTFSLANMTWQGEGYGVSYFPRNKTKKNITGISVRDLILKDFIINNLKLEQSKLWQISFKKNVLKQMDETNRCKQIITDDSLNLHVALALRKNVQYVIPQELPYKIELFGNGSIHFYNHSLIRNFNQDLQHVT